MSNPDFNREEDIEGRLRAVLQDYAPEADEQLWAGIADRLPKPRRRRPVFFWMLTGLAAATMLSGLLALRAGKNFRGAEQVTMTAASLPAAPEQPVRTIEPAPTPARSVQVAPKQKDLVLVGNRASGLPSERIQDEMPALEAQLVANESFFRPIPTENIPVEAPARLPVSPSNDPGIQWEQAPVFTTPVKPRRSEVWELGVQSAPFWIGHPNVQTGNGQKVFAESPKGPGYGWEKGFTLTYALSPHWRLAFGGSHRSWTQYSSHEATLRLMDGICLNPNDLGPKEYEFKYALQSGENQSNVTVRIAQVDTAVSMPSDEPFVLSMHSALRGSDWVLPFAVQRTFKWSTWQGYVQAGAQWTFPGRTEMQVQHFSEECVDLCFASGRIPLLTLSAHRKPTMVWQLGMGLKYQMTSRWGLSISPTMFGKKGMIGLALNTGLNLKL